VSGQMRKRGGKNGFRNRFVQQSLINQRYLEEGIEDLIAWATNCGR
jgi:hypothetical protein